MQQVLQGAEPAQMTVEEQAALRAGLREQLHISEAPVPAAIPARRSRWWVPVFGLAAAAAAFVGFVALGPFDGSDDGAIEIAAEPTAEDTTLEEQGATMSRSEGDTEAPTTIAAGSAEEAPPSVSGLDEDTAADAAEPTTTMAAAAEAGPPVAYAMNAGSTQSTVPDIADAVPPAPELYASLQRSGFSTDPETSGLADDSVGEETVLRDDLEACQGTFSAVVSLDLVLVEPLATGTSNGSEVVILLLQFENLSYFTVTVELASCAIVDSAPAAP